MPQKISKNPFAFGFFTSMLQKKWAIGAISAVLVATWLQKLAVVFLRDLTDALTAAPLIFDAVWFWAIAYSLLFLSR